MRLLSLCSVALLGLASASFGIGGCDDSTSDDEAALPGVGPIGAGGAPDFGAGGAAGSAAGQAGSGVSGGSGQGGAPACTGGGEGKVRLAAMRARAGKVDVCAAPTGPGAADWTTATRLVRSLGDAAHDGLAFGEVASPSTLGSGTMSLKVIDAAAADCTGEALASRDVCLAAGDDLTLVLLADALVPFVNAPATGGNRLRFIHAYAGGPGLDVGLVDPDTGMLISPIFTNITYGTTAPAAATSSLGPPVLASGYLDLPASDTTEAAPVGAAPTGQTASVLSTIVDLGAPKGRVLTAYALGASGDASFPLAGRLCDETKTGGALTTCQSF